MPDLFQILFKWRRQIVATVLGCVAVVSIIVFLKPAEYLSTATALPSNPYANDKASVFNASVQQLYSALGTPDDLDRIIGTGQLDTVYISMADSFRLVDHYHLSTKGSIGEQKAALRLKKNTRVMKSEYGELKVKVWDTDRVLAAAIANAIMQRLSDIHTDLQAVSNASVLEGLKKGRENLLNEFFKLPYQSNIPGPRKYDEEIDRYQDLINQYQLMVDSKAPVLVIVERARAAIYADRPERWLIIGASFLLSLLFAMAVALLLERRSKSST